MSSFVAVAGLWFASLGRFLGPLVSPAADTLVDTPLSLSCHSPLTPWPRSFESGDALGIQPLLALEHWGAAHVARIAGVSRAATIRFLRKIRFCLLLSPKFDGKEHVTRPLSQKKKGKIRKTKIK